MLFHFLFSFTRVVIIYGVAGGNVFSFFLFFSVEPPIMGFEVHFLNNNKTNHLIRLLPPHFLGGH